MEAQCLLVYQEYDGKLCCCIRTQGETHQLTAGSCSCRQGVLFKLLQLASLSTRASCLCSAVSNMVAWTKI